MKGHTGEPSISLLLTYVSLISNAIIHTRYISRLQRDAVKDFILYKVGEKPLRAQDRGFSYK